MYDDDVDWATIRPQDNSTTPIDATMVQHGRRGQAEDSLSIEYQRCDPRHDDRWRSEVAREAWSASHNATHSPPPRGARCYHQSLGGRSADSL